MRKGVVLGLITLVASLAVASCGEGGTGVGSAPPEAPPCPASVPAADSPCSALQVCDYSSDASPGSDLVAVCPFAGGTWQVHARGDGGVFADAEIPEVLTDASDAPDAAETTDAVDDDATDVFDAPETLDDTAPADTAVTADTADDSASDGG